MGMVETFISFDSAGVVGGSYPETSTGGLLGGCVGFVPKGLNCEKKFVPVPGSWGVGFFVLKDKKTKITIVTITSTIIRSIKFLFDIIY